MNAMKRIRAITFLILATASVTGASLVCAQQGYTGFFAHNTSMSALQPSLVTPLVTADPRLVQYARIAFSNEYTAARTQTVNYGNGRGIGVIVGNRLEADYFPPSFIQHNVATSKNGLSDTSALVKVRVASGDAKLGKFEIAALLGHSFATGTYKNGAMTDTFSPTLVGGYSFQRYSVITSLGGVMPTGKIAVQGRSIAWNALVQARAAKHIVLEVENNATFYFRGSHDGKMQNFVTPGTFYIVRPKRWGSTHPYLVFAEGMQIATSSFHTYNHNLISEVRILF
jgi:hypothetical protein